MKRNASDIINAAFKSGFSRLKFSFGVMIAYIHAIIVLEYGKRAISIFAHVHPVRSAICTGSVPKLGGNS